MRVCKCGHVKDDHHDNHGRACCARVKVASVNDCDFCPCEKFESGRPVGPQEACSHQFRTMTSYKCISCGDEPKAPTPVEGKEWCQCVLWNPYKEEKGRFYWKDAVAINFGGSSGYSYPQQHNIVHIVPNKYKFCPYCAAPRPAKESLEEKFDKYIKQQATADWHGTQRSVSVEELAEIARKFYEKKS